MGTVSEELYIGWSQAGNVPVSILPGVEAFEHRGQYMVHGRWRLGYDFNLVQVYIFTPMLIYTPEAQHMNLIHHINFLPVHSVTQLACTYWRLFRSMQCKTSFSSHSLILS